MTTSFQPRKPAGSPQGGQFDSKPHAAVDLDLDSEDVFHKRYDTMDKKLEAIRAELDTAVKNLDTDANWLAYLNQMHKFHNYSFNNQMLIYMQRPDAERVASFRTWKGLGRSVTKGEHGIQILRPVVVRLKEDDGTQMLDENGRPVLQLVGFKTGSVFDVSQTHGKPLLERDHAQVEAPAQLQQNLTRMIEKRGFKIVVRKILSGADGYTAPLTREVVIDERLSEAEQARVMAHELGHIVAGHLERFDEYHTGHDGNRGQMEVEADSIAHVIFRASGVNDEEATRGHAQYLWGWSKVQDRTPEMVQESAERVCQSVHELLGDDEWVDAPIKPYV